MHAICTQGYTVTVRESAPKVDSGRKIPCRTGDSNLRRRRAGPMLYYQLSFIHTRDVYGNTEPHEYSCGSGSTIAFSPVWRQTGV